MDEDTNLIKNLEAFGDLYCKRYLTDWENHAIRTNWWTGLRFFLNHTFMRGRKDRLSEEYYSFTEVALRGHFKIPENPGTADYIRLSKDHRNFLIQAESIAAFKKSEGMKQSQNAIDNDFFKTKVAAGSELIAALTVKKKGLRPLNNDKDLLMVLSALAFMTEEGMPENVYLYILDKVRTGQEEEIRARIDKVYAVGDKISTFILRDIILMNPGLAIGDQNLVFPVDTWVTKIAKSLGCGTEQTNDVRDFFIKKTQDAGADVAKIAAGVWYMGFHSLDILARALSKHDFYANDINVAT